MSSIRNHVTLVGNLGSDPETKSLASGSSVAKFSLATNENYKNKEGEKVTETTWHNIVVWGKLAEIAGKFLKKGSEVAVSGRIANRSWVTDDGLKKYITEIVIDDLVMLHTGNNTSPSNVSQPHNSSEDMPSEAEFNAGSQSN